MICSSLLGLCGCTDDESPPCQPNDGINGSWSLIEVFETFIGPTSFSANEVIWVFEDNVLTISFVEGFDTFDSIPLEFREPTQFDYVLSNDTVTFADFPWGYKIESEGAMLVLNGGSMFDGPILTFESICP